MTQYWPLSALGVDAAVNESGGGGGGGHIQREETGGADAMDTEDSFHGRYERLAAGGHNTHFGERTALPGIDR